MRPEERLRLEQREDLLESWRRDIEETKWLYLVMEGEVEQPDHECTPDCSHWRDEKEKP